MTETHGALPARLEHFLRSVSLLSETTPEIPVLSQSVKELGRLAGALPSSGPQPSRDRSLDGAWDLLAQVRLSLELVVSSGSVDRSAEGATEQVWSVLDLLERSLRQEMRRGPSSRVYGLYVIIDPEVTGGRDPVDVAAAALRGGARILQLRDKLGEKGRSLQLAKALKELCVRHGGLLIINDHADVAAVACADGLHIGQGDLPMPEARRVLHPNQIIGRSNHTLAELVESQDQGADHVAIGAVYPTTTKESIVRRATLGPEALRKAREAVSVPLVAIGGIGEGSIAPVVKAGADAICVTSAVGLAQDPEQASRRLVAAILEAGGKA